MLKYNGEAEEQMISWTPPCTLGIQHPQNSVPMWSFCNMFCSTDLWLLSICVDLVEEPFLVCSWRSSCSHLHLQTLGRWVANGQSNPFHSRLPIRKEELSLPATLRRVVAFLWMNPMLITCRSSRTEMQSGKLTLREKRGEAWFWDSVIRLSWGSWCELRVLRGGTDTELCRHTVVPCVVNHHNVVGFVHIYWGGARKTTAENMLRQMHV